MVPVVLGCTVGVYKGRELRGAIRIEEPQVQPVWVACGLRMPPEWALLLGCSRVTITGAQFSGKQRTGEQELNPTA